MYKFEILQKDGKARIGIITTKHGKIHTPAFINVATQGAMKSLTIDQMKQVGAQVLLANTYHLHLRPGEEVVEKCSGLHKFMNWDGPIITDSGGFQVFSLGINMVKKTGKIGSVDTQTAGEKALATIYEDRVEFRSHIDQSLREFTPELSMKIQQKLGADIIISFDECTSPFHTHQYTKESMNRTHRWAQQCLDHHTTPQALFGVVQGGHYKDLRQESARFVSKLPFQGIAIGGCLGHDKKEMYDVVDWTTDILPEEKARHLLGIGNVDDIFECVERGIDLFDCVTPTRQARIGRVYLEPRFGGSSKNKWGYRVLKEEYKDDTSPLVKGCECWVCGSYSKAYIRHLIKAKETLGYTLVSYHNLHMLHRLFEDIRQALKEERFKELKKEWLM